MRGRIGTRCSSFARTGRRATVFLVLIVPPAISGCQDPGPGGAGASSAAAVGAPAADAPRPAPAPSPGATAVSGTASEAVSAAKDDPDEVVTVPDVSLTDQDGKAVRFVSDLLRDRVFLVNFAFTRCRGVCPILGANCARIERALGQEGVKNVALITISVDPEADTPEALRTWRSQFDAGSGWTLVTGARREIDPLLKALRVYSADKAQHAQSVVIGDGRRFRLDGRGGAVPIRRLNGLTAPGETARLLKELSDHPAQTARDAGELSPAETYFTTWDSLDEDGQPVKVRRDLTLINQDGKAVRFYADLLKDRNVVVHAFFTRCNGACPRMFGTLSKLQTRLGDRVGNDVFFLSITVEPGTDTRDRLKGYAEQLHARPGWSFLTGRVDDVEAIVRKFQPQFVARDTHSTRFFLGNLRTHAWAKPDVATNNDEEIIAAAEKIWSDDTRAASLDAANP